MAGALVFGAAATDVVDSGLLAGIPGNETQYTVLAWVNLTTFTSQRVIWARGGGNARFIRLTGTAGDVQGGTTRAGGTTNYSTTSAPLALNTWCFLAFTFDLSAGAGLKVAAYSGRESVPASACTMVVTTETGTTLTDDSAFHTFWGNNSPGLASALQGSMAYGAWFPGVLSLAQIQSWQDKPRQVVTSSVASELKLFGVGGADAIDLSGNVDGVVSGATQGTGPSTSLVVSKYAVNRALLASMGVTDAQAFSVKDARICIKRDRTSWFDAMAPQGTVNGRAQGVTATGVNVPTIASEGIVFDGVNDRLASAQDARLLFDAATPLYCLAIYKATGNGPVFGAAADPTNASLFPQGYLQTAGGNHKALLNPTGAGTGSVAPDSALPWNDGLIRAAVIGRTQRSGGTTSGDDGWHYDLLGRQEQTFIKNTQATTVAGGLKEFVGGIGATFGPITLYHQMWLAVEITPAMKAAYKAFGIAEFGADVETSTEGVFVCSSHSVGAGTQTTNPLTPSIGSGTTTWPYLVVNTTTVRGKLATKIGLTDVHQYNISVGGRTTPAATAQFAHEIAPVFDGLRTGPKVLVAMWITNDERVLQSTLAQLKLDMQAYYAACVAAGVTLVLLTAPGYGTGLVGAANGCYAAPTGTTLSSEGVILIAMNAELRANRALYCDRLIDVAADVRFDPVTRACADLTYWNSDQTHPTDAGQVALASIVNNDFDINGYFWPSPSAVALQLYMDDDEDHNMRAA